MEFQLYLNLWTDYRGLELGLQQTTLESKVQYSMSINHKKWIVI
jgi:hypothetical protein